MSLGSDFKNYPNIFNVVMNYILFEHVKYALATNRIEATWDLKEILTFFTDSGVLILWLFF